MIRREAINLKVNDVECAGTFFYNEVSDIRTTPKVIIRRESWLEFTVPSTAPKKEVDSFGYLFIPKNKEIDIEDNGKIYKAVISEWSRDKLKKIYTGRMEMINKWYE